jgi:hypothetical protein
LIRKYTVLNSPKHYAGSPVRTRARDDADTQKLSGVEAPAAYAA